MSERSPIWWWLGTLGPPVWASDFCWQPFSRQDSTGSGLEPLALYADRHQRCADEQHPGRRGASPPGALSPKIDEPQAHERMAPLSHHAHGEPEQCMVAPPVSPGVLSRPSCRGRALVLRRGDPAEWAVCRRSAVDPGARTLADSFTPRDTETSSEMEDPFQCRAGDVPTSVQIRDAAARTTEAVSVLPSGAHRAPVKPAGPRPAEPPPRNRVVTPPLRIWRCWTPWQRGQRRP
jgi:hypothetical protein